MFLCFAVSGGRDAGEGIPLTIGKERRIDYDDDDEDEDDLEVDRGFGFSVKTRLYPAEG